MLHTMSKSNLNTTKNVRFYIQRNFDFRVWIVNYQMCHASLLAVIISQWYDRNQRLTLNWHVEYKVKRDLTHLATNAWLWVSAHSIVHVNFHICMTETILIKLTAVLSDSHNFSQAAAAIFTFVWLKTCTFLKIA